jgi:hypothetical protein
MAVANSEPSRVARCANRQVAKVKRSLFILLGIAAALFAAWDLWLFPSWMIRYRLTIEVAVADEIKSGSGVIETIWHKQSNDPLTEVPWGLEIRGEAISIDLNSHSRLFALLGPPEAPRRGLLRKRRPSWPLLEAFAPNLTIGTMTGDVLSSLVSRRDVVDLAPNLLPMLVRFRDIDDPKTVEEVDPSDLVSGIGSGVKIMRATVQIVSPGLWPFNKFDAPFPKWLFGEKVTTGIERQLPSWYEKLEESTRSSHEMLALAGGTTMNNAPLANSLSTFSFQRGIEP